MSRQTFHYGAEGRAKLLHDELYSLISCGTDFLVVWVDDTNIAHLGSHVDLPVLLLGCLLLVACLFGLVD